MFSTLGVLFSPYILEIVAAAHDPLEVEENYVIQQLTLHMPNNYDVAGK